MSDRIELSAPDIGEAEIAAVESVLRSGRLSLGPWLARFEEVACETLGAPHAVAVSSGTAALDCALRALGIGPGDEVVTSPFSFVASANAILHVGATPIFADVEADSLNLDPGRIAEKLSPRTRAILVVHVFGRPADMAAILAIAREHDLLVIEDACEAVGARRGGRHAGTMGDVGVFGFYPNKAMTTGEGGLVVTPSREVAESCRSLANQGRRPGSGWFEHVELGFNYRLSELHAALGAVQMGRLGELLRRRREVASRYDALLQDADVDRPELEPHDVEMSWFVYVVRLRSESTDRRDAIMEELRSRRVASARYFPPIHLLPPWRARFGFETGDFPITENAAARTLALPFHGGLDGAVQERVRDALLAALDLTHRA